MFAHRYFAARAFAPRYFPPGPAGGGGGMFMLGHFIATSQLRAYLSRRRGRR